MSGSEAQPREWGWWTEHKLDILSEYFAAFTRASKKSSEKVYMDLFAGTPENRSRLTGDVVDGSARRALDTTPPFTRVSLIETPENAARLRQDIVERYARRSGIRVYEGDCNVQVTAALRDLRPWYWAPSLALLDPYAFGVQWTTLVQLSRFKRSNMPKMELLILLGHGFAARILQVNQELMNAKAADQISDLYGDNSWFAFIHALQDGMIDAQQFRDELVNLLRWKLERQLGYKFTHTITFHNTGGSKLYDLVFASDHPAGDAIMRAVYRKAVPEQQRRRQHALAFRHVKRQTKKAEDGGQEPLFPIGVDVVRGKQVDTPDAYIHEPPHPPLEYRRGV